VKATYAMLSQATVPLTESGYYVLPVSSVDKTFRQNGLTIPADIYAMSVAKLRKIFGADTALHVSVTEYGSKYQIISSIIRVATKAKLWTLRRGDVL
jgi:hypothetical protein